MTGRSAPFDVRPCRLGDVSRIRHLLKASWHATYDPIMGEREALHRGRRVYSTANLAMWIALSRLSLRATKMLVATRDDVAVGLAMAQRDEAEIVLYMLYVDPERKGRGIGTALLQALVGSYPGAKAIRLEVLKGNVAAIAWYKAQGFEVYGEISDAAGGSGIAALYLDKKLDHARQRR